MFLAGILPTDYGIICYTMKLTRYLELKCWSSNLLQGCKWMEIYYINHHILISINLLNTLKSDVLLKSDCPLKSNRPLKSYHPLMSNCPLTSHGPLMCDCLSKSDNPWSSHQVWYFPQAWLSPHIWLSLKTDHPLTSRRIYRGADKISTVYKCKNWFC